MTYTIGSKIKQYRELRKLSQKELASRIGISNSRLSNWEKGENRPDVDALKELCRVLNVSPSVLLDMEPAIDNLDETERRIISEYRQKTDLQKAVKILLGIDNY